MTPVGAAPAEEELAEEGLAVVAAADVVVTLVVETEVLALVLTLEEEELV